MLVGTLIVSVSIWSRSVGSDHQAASTAWTLGLLGVVALLSLFGAWTLYALDVGTDSAQDIAERLPSRPAISVYSKEHLAVGGRGVTSVAVQGRYSVRYDGLRLLARTNDGVLYLLSKQWRHGVDPVYEIKDDADTRLEIIATPMAAAS
jgi:energy-converting hydrogenase Eha subunit H